MPEAFHTGLFWDSNTRMLLNEAGQILTW